MSLQEFCPVCAVKGIKTRIKSYQINFEEAMYMCPQNNCSWPFQKDHELFFFERPVGLTTNEVWEEQEDKFLKNLCAKKMHSHVIAVDTPPQTPGTDFNFKDIDSNCTSSYATSCNKVYTSTPILIKNEEVNSKENSQEFFKEFSVIPNKAYDVDNNISIKTCSIKPKLVASKSVNYKLEKLSKKEYFSKNELNSKVLPKTNEEPKNVENKKSSMLMYRIKMKTTTLKKFSFDNLKKAKKSTDVTKEEIESKNIESDNSKEKKNNMENNCLSEVNSLTNNSKTNQCQLDSLKDVIEVEIQPKNIVSDNSKEKQNNVENNCLSEVNSLTNNSKTNQCQLDSLKDELTNETLCVENTSDDKKIDFNQFYQEIDKINIDLSHLDNSFPTIDSEVPNHSSNDMETCDNKDVELFKSIFEPSFLETSNDTFNVIQNKKKSDIAKNVVTGYTSYISPGTNSIKVMENESKDDVDFLDEFINDSDVSEMLNGSFKAVENNENTCEYDYVFP